MLEWQGDCAVLRDLGSANGLRVNGEEVETIEIRPGDVIEFGDEVVDGDDLLARLDLP